ncbi:hypothetical protein pEaSNUABM37_00345 [Erwinia phage pEa_SNUABM_37]|nr:hypothetical protein pEaSNUABM37_00345 [Erwinia phage pEa_SNUABM_37]QXO10813.1 hypothetical protein pEaSNUABM48_00345 [Erwinia phage pEa_SNUABM_48]
MPIVKRQIKEQHKSIIRPVVIDVVNDLIRFMELKPNTDIIFKGYSDIAMMPNGYMGLSTDNATRENIRTVGRERIFIEMEEENPETTLLEMPVTYPEWPYIFADESLGIFIYPIKERTSIRLNFVNRFMSKGKADAWLSHMKQLMAQLVKDYIHQATYNYAYPDEVIGLIHTLWKYRENQGGYNETFSQYFRGYSTNKLTAIANQSGSQTDLVIAETADNITGNWEFDTPPFPTKANNLGNWQASFSYRFEFDKPLGMVIQYPIAIHNQVLDESLIPKRRLPSYRGKVYHKPYQQQRFEGIQEDIGQSYDPRLTDWLIYPDIDEWQLPTFDYKFIPQYQVLLAVNPEDKKELVSLRELGPYQFTARALKYLQHVGVKCFHHHQSIIQLALFCGDDLIDPNDIEMDPRTWVVRCKYDLDIRKQYRLVIYIDADLRRLWEDTVSDLKDRGVWTQEVISVIYPDRVPPIDEDGRVTDEEWRKLIDGIDWSKLPSTDTLYIGRFVIIARSERDGYR